MEILLKNKKTLDNNNMLFNGRNDAVKFVDDYASMILGAKRKAAEEPTKGKELKILTPQTNASNITSSSNTSKSR